MPGSRPNPLFADLWRALEDLKTSRHYEERAFVFRDGEPCAGIYLLEKGEINLLLPAQSKQHRLFEVVGPGAVLGLSEAMSGSPHKLMAEAAQPVDLAYIERMVFMKFLRKHQLVCMEVVQLLSEDLHGLYHRFRAMAPVEGKPRKRLSIERVQ